MSNSKLQMGGRRAGKSRMNTMVKEEFARMGMEPCKLCSVPGKWEIFHPPERPCPKATPSRTNHAR